MSRKPPSRRNQWFSRILKRRSRRRAQSRQCLRRLTPVEGLEARRLLAITPMFAAGQLTITGDGANDTVSISTIDVAGTPQVTVNGQAIGTGVDASAVTSIVANLGGGNDTMNLSSLDFSKFTGLVNNSVTLNGQAGNDTLTGTSIGDILNGGDGNDTIDGRAGDDHLIGGNGNDTLVGGAGDDRIDTGLNDDVVSFGGTGDLGSDTIIQAASGNLDTLVFSNLGGAITIDIGTTALQVVRAGQLSITLSDANGFDNVQGTAYADTIYGNSGGNSLMGNGGDDVIYGRHGNDWLDGGSGNDSLFGQGGDDTLLGKGGNDALYGGEGSDAINGNEGVDFLAGDEGNDTYTATAYGTKSIAAAPLGDNDRLDLGSLTLTGSIDLNSTEPQALTSSLSIRLAAPGAVAWLPGKGTTGGVAAQGLYQNGYYTVPGPSGETTTIAFKYGGAFAAYYNTFWVTGTNPDGSEIPAEHIFTGRISVPGSVVSRSYSAGSVLSFFIEQNQFLEPGSAPDIFYSDNFRNDNDTAADSNRPHLKVLDLAPDELQLSWEDLYYERPNPQGFTFDGDFNDLFLSVRAVQPALVDIDIDSDNNNHLASPDRSRAEDKAEDSQGKKIVSNANDSDGDGIPDYRDFLGVAGKFFTPLVIQVAAGIPISAMNLSLDYDSSNPLDVGSVPSGTMPDGALRIWTRDVWNLRDGASVAAGGHFLAPGEYTDLTQLGFSDEVRTRTFYVEGIALTEGSLSPISVTVSTDSGLEATDTVNVLVVENRLVIGIDGTGQRAWLSGPNGQRANGLWNSHVRNLIDDVSKFYMTIYDFGVDENDGGDAGIGHDRVLEEAETFISDAGGGTQIALVGWSRGAMQALWVGNDLAAYAGGASASRTVEFVGMYDPVDMSFPIPDGMTIHSGIQSVTIVGPRDDSPNTFNVDYPGFIRLSLNDQIQADSPATTVVRQFYNASHGAIGGTPGYNLDVLDPSDGGTYSYLQDRQNSILSDTDIRNGLIAAGFTFVQVRTAEWYGIPTTRPPKSQRVSVTSLW